MLILPKDWRPQGIEELEKGAWDALKETERSVCVTAGAGAGKTEFLAQKATYLLQTGLCPGPKRILAISFKRDAAKNLDSRVRKRCPEDQARRFHSMTFDSFTKHLLDNFRMAVPDDYRPTADYNITFPTKDSLKDFLRRQGRPDINSDRFEKAIPLVPLPVEENLQDPSKSKLLKAYWDELYGLPEGSLLSFAMINRLVEYLLRVNPRIKRALHLTYPFVFLDEFQDTTCSQYDLIKTAFGESETLFTAVGDDKQKIMGWAGAMDNSFEKFTMDFNAVSHALLCNWRSHKALVAIQHVIAQRIDPDVEEVEARGDLDVDGQTGAIWRFDSSDQETAQIANWIRREVEERRVEPHDVAILVRNRADVVENELAPFLADKNLVLRNLARKVDKIAIQDLLAEPLTEVVLPLLRLGSSASDPDAWNTTQEQFQKLEGISNEDELGLYRLQRDLEDYTKKLRQTMHEEKIDGASVERVFAQAIEFAGTERLRQAYPQYRREQDFHRVHEGFRLLMKECVEDSTDWKELLDRFEGKGQVPLMTIHKSKGLEFHTMIFFGLDEETWWSLKPDRGEELNSFFVALTRAMQRAFFSYCAERGNAFTWLENLLLPAGVEKIDGAEIA